MKIIIRVILSLLLVCLVVGSFYFSTTPIVHHETVSIEVKGNLVYIGALAEDRKVTIKATYGLVRIQIKGKKVAVVDAECSDQICVKTGWRSRLGESIFCEANELIIHIVGKQSQGDM